MESQKNNKVVIILLIIVIVILLVLCILFVTGTISLKSNNVENNEINEYLSEEYNITVNNNEDKQKDYLEL